MLVIPDFRIRCIIPDHGIRYALKASNTRLGGLAIGPNSHPNTRFNASSYFCEQSFSLRTSAARSMPGHDACNASCAKISYRHKCYESECSRKSMYVAGAQMYACLASFIT